MIPEVSILDGMDGVWVGMGRYRMDGHPRHTFTGISQAPINLVISTISPLEALYLLARLGVWVRLGGPLRP
jgi:hypothetical protein